MSQLNKGSPSCQPQESRDTPTLSLKGSVWVSLFFVLLQFSTSFVYAQNNKENISPLGNVLIANCDLPGKVYLNQKKKIQINITFTEIDAKGKELAPLSVSALGSGEVLSPNVVITNRHLLLDPVFEILNRGYDFIIDANGFPQGVRYGYKIYGTVSNEFGTYDFPLSLKAVERLESRRDVMALEVLDSKTRNMSQANDRMSSRYESDIPNPYKILNEPLELSSDISVADPVYLSGFSVGGNFDVIDFTFCGQLSAKVANETLERSGVKMYYRIYGRAEHGFSGGPTFNKAGQVIGITTMGGGNNFVYVLSAKDIKDFMNEHKIDVK